MKIKNDKIDCLFNEIKRIFISLLLKYDMSHMKK